MMKGIKYIEGNKTTLILLYFRERISKAKSIFDKRALELLNRAKLRKSKLKQKGGVLPMQSSANKPDYSQVISPPCSLFLL